MANEMTAARAIVEVMRRERVEKAFCVPGESYLSVMDALYDSNIELISGRQEGGVSFMAEAYAKATGEVGVCFATRGPGATNLSIGLHTAYQDSTPVVAFIGQVESYFRGKEGFQEIDLAEYFSHIVKWTAELREPDRVPELVHRAFHIARSGRPGPVLISLPENILREVAEMNFSKEGEITPPRASLTAIEKTKNLLQSAKKPVIIAGGGVTHSRSPHELVKVAEALGAPVVTAFRRFDAFPNEHELYIGSLGLATPSYLLSAIKEADVILALGTRFSQITSQDYSLIQPFSKLIHVDISERELNKVYRPTLGIVSDVKAFLIDLNESINQGTNQCYVDERTQMLRKKYVEFSRARSISSESHVNMEGFIKDLNEVLENDAIVTTDAGNFFGWLDRYFSFKGSRKYIGPTSGAMGYGLPAAIGAKLANPNQQVVALAGDGGTMMTVQELETAVRYNVPVIMIVINNNIYGTIRMHQEKHYPKRVIATDLTNPNFAELMKTMGGYGIQVKQNKDVRAALDYAISCGGPCVVEILTDSEQITVSNTIREIRGISC